MHASFILMNLDAPTFKDMTIMSMIKTDLWAYLRPPDLWSPKPKTTEFFFNCATCVKEKVTTDCVNCSLT